MAVVLSRLVVLAVAFVLALPPGWCCLARTGCCGASAKTKPQPAQEKIECYSCCHAATPAGPSIGTGSCCNPTPPAKACCCERAHTTKPTTGPQLPVELPALSIFTPVADDARS